MIYLSLPTVSNLKNMNTKFLTMIFIIFSGITGISQSLPVNKYKGDLSASVLRSRNTRFHSFFQFDFGLHYTFFQNPRFFDVTDKKLIQPQHGYQLRLNVVLHPITIYGQYFSSYFDASKYPGWNYVNDTRIRHSGLALGAHTQILPFTKISKFINPTAGLAYRNADICANCKAADNKKTHVIKPMNELVWTFGTQIHFSRFFYLAGEYSQSFLASPIKNSAVSISLGYKYAQIY